MPNKTHCLVTTGSDSHTHISFDDVFFMYDINGRIIRHTLLRDYNISNHNALSNGIVEYSYNEYENTVTKFIKGNDIFLTKLITEDSDTILTLSDRYRLTGFPNSLKPVKLVITNGRENDKQISHIKVMFGILDSIVYYPTKGIRVITRKLDIGDNTFIVTRNVIDNATGTIVESKQTTVKMTIIDGLVCYSDDNSASAYNEQGHVIYYTGTKTIKTRKEEADVMVRSGYQSVKLVDYSKMICNNLDFNIGLLEELI